MLSPPPFFTFLWPSVLPLLYAAQSNALSHAGALSLRGTLDRYEGTKMAGQNGTGPNNQEPLDLTYFLLYFEEF